MLTSLAPCQLKKKYDIILSEQFNEIPARGKGLKHPSPATPTCGRSWEIKMNLAAHTKQNSGTNLCTNPSPTPQEKSKKRGLYKATQGNGFMIAVTNIEMYLVYWS